jgi:hypothetical protein
LSFVSKSHFEIFGCLFPNVFKNWYHSEWIDTIYASYSASNGTSVVVNAGEYTGSRHEICSDLLSKTELQEMITDSKKKINKWLD